ncbi:MAG: hypothetical protein KH431_01230 [Erysipelotrichaceae bacterium]|nr:hypothetical protein [Erysipelotrichaceae bacterium]
MKKIITGVALIAIMAGCLLAGNVEQNDAAKPVAGDRWGGLIAGDRWGGLIA